MAIQGQDQSTAATDQGPMGSIPVMQLLSDRPLTDDRNDSLGFTAYADALAGIIGDSKTDTPLTIAISAEWGAGKTSLARLIEAKLLDDKVFPKRQNITCWFNAWMHDDAPNLGSAFAAMVAKDINRYRPIWRRLVSPLPSNFYSPQERWHYRILMGLTSFFIVALAALVPNIRTLLRKEISNSPVTAQINSSLSGKWAAVAVLVIAVVVASRLLFGIAQAAARFVDNPQAEAARGSMQSVHNQLAGLIEQATRGRASLLHRRSFHASRLVIFVDDLERCRPPRALDVCEVANQLLSVEGVVTILVADMQAIATSVIMKYFPEESGNRPDGIDSSGMRLSPLKYGRAYLDKMIQIQFSVPISPPEALQRMLATVAGKEFNERSEQDQDIQHAEGLSQASPEQAVQPQHDPGEAPAKLGLQRQREHEKGTQSANETSEIITKVKRLRKSYDAWATVLGAVLFFGWIPFLVSVLLINPSWWWIVIPADAALIVVALIPTWRASNKLESMTGTDKDEELDKYIKKISEKTNSVEELREAVQGSSAALNASTELINQRIQRFVVDESRLRQRAELTVSLHIPILPRGAKRAINQLRVTLAIAERRGMFDRNTLLQPEHLGKWVVLIERWPDMAARLASNPQMIVDLESLSVSDMSRKISDMLPEEDDVDGLCNLLQSEPKMQPVLDHLVRFEPWELTAESSLRQSRGSRDSTDAVHQQEIGELGQVIS